MAPLRLVRVARVLSTPPDARSRERHVLAKLRIEERRYRSLCRELEEQRDQLRVLTSRCLRAKEEEARRIAHQLHDEAAQLTAAIHLALVDVERALPPQSHDKTRRAQHLLDCLAERLRHFSHELRPTILDDLGFAPALGCLAEAFTARTGTPVAVRGDVGGRRLPRFVETALYRIVHEALSNIARHAQARRVWVSLRRARGLLRLAVRDDGVGFDVRAAARATRGGLGLLGIRERLVALGGRFEIRSRPGRGAELSAAIPLRNQSWPVGFCSPMTTSSCAKA